MGRYLTVPDELLGVAEAAENYFRSRGYRIKIEYRDLAYPYVSAFTAVRKPTSVIVDVVSGLNLERVRQWMRYCKSSARDTRFCTCIRREVGVAAEIQAALRADGIGLYYANDNFIEILMPADQGLVLQLPDLGNFPASVRDLLGPSYEKFERGDWRECFSDACEAFENEARAHLKRGLRSTRIRILDKKGALKKFSNAQIDRKTIGQLQHEFDQIQAPNYLDSQIAQTLAAINPDRVRGCAQKEKGAHRGKPA